MKKEKKSLEDTAQIQNLLGIDTDSFRSGDKNHSVQPMNLFGDENLNETDKFDNEEEKGDMYSAYIDALKNQTTQEVIDVMKDYQLELDFKLKDVFINLLVLHERKDAYEKVKEFLEDNIGNIPLEDALLVQELPETYDELTDNKQDRQQLRENAWKLSLKHKLKSVLNVVIPMDKDNLVLNVEDLKELDEIGFQFLNKVKVTVTK
jgi:hypothetical protein